MIISLALSIRIAPSGRAAATRSATKSWSPMKLSVCVSLRQLLIQFHYSSSFEALGHPGVTSLKALLTLTDDTFRARLRLVGYQVFIRCQVTVTVGVGLGIRASIRKVGKQVPLVIVLA